MLEKTIFHTHTHTHTHTHKNQLVLQPKPARFNEFLEIAYLIQC